MQFNFAFTTPQILWTLTLAAQLVLLVVLFGLQRLKRFPWFAVSVLVIALRAVAAEMLTGRISTFTLQELLVSLDALTALIMLLVVVELARRAFASVRWRNWWWGVLAIVVVAIASTIAWGHWPSWHSLTADPSTAVLRVINLAASRISLLGNLLTIELCLLVLVLGSRFKAGWRSHTQQILIGLSTAAIAQIAVVTAFQAMTPPHTRSEQTHQFAFINAILNANSTIYIVVLVWWIGCLWLDEPATELATAEAKPVATEAEPVEAPTHVAEEPEPIAAPIATLPAFNESVPSQELLPAPEDPVPAQAPAEAAVAPAQIEEVIGAPVVPAAVPAKPKRSKKPVGASAEKRDKKQSKKTSTSEILVAPVVATPVKEKKPKAAKPAKKKVQAAVAEPSSDAAPNAAGSPSRAPRKKSSGATRSKKNTPPVQAP
jgi:hypothetical protein